ncbi:pre-60S factor rei1 [Cryptotrichosporon argae]
MVFTCISCRVAFEQAEEQRSHFATDWHRYNMKRRVASLPPVSAATFNEKVLQRREQNAVRPDPRGMQCGACNKQFATENAYRTHIQSKKHREREAYVASRPAKAADETEAGPSEPPTLVEDGDETDEDEEMDEDEDEEDEGEGDIEARIASARRKIQPLDCLFCANHFGSIDANLAHMKTAHSFFIPDRDILVDLPGLLSYLGEKVALGNLCLYCPNGGKEFGSTEAVRRHMRDKGHCKIAYETDEDRAELADYYDFGGDDDWEDADSDGDEVMDEETASSLPTLASDGLSLALPSGRVLGHRSLKVYYAQKLRPPQAAGAPSAGEMKVARVRELLADPTQAMVPVAGGHGRFGRGLEMIKARNAGEAKWARKQGSAFHDQNRREQYKTKMGFKHNNQKHFRDPLLQ